MAKLVHLLLDQALFKVKGNSNLRTNHLVEIIETTKKSNLIYFAKVGKKGKHKSVYMGAVLLYVCLNI